MIMTIAPRFVDKLVKLAAVMLVAGVWVIGCTGSCRAQGEELRIALWALPQEGANPLSNSAYPAIMILPAIFDSLTVVEQSGLVKPALAISWRRRDALTWEFQLRPGASFSNGELFTAAAVVNAFEYLATAAGSTTAVARSVAMVAHAQAEEEHVVVLVTKYPSPRLPYEISAVRIPAPQHWHDLGAQQFALDPVGTGPYTPETWGAGEVVMKEFSDSWRRPITPRLHALTLPDETTRLQALLSDSVDVAAALSPENGPLLNGVGAHLIHEASASILGLSYVVTEDSPLQDARVRRALNFAVNRNAIAVAFYDGVTEPASQVVIPEAFGHDPDLKPYPFDPARASLLLAEAGYETGFDLPIEVTTSFGGNVAAVYQQVAADLARINIRIELIPMSPATLVQRINAGGWRGMAFSMDYNSSQALGGLRVFKLHSCLRPVPWFCEPDDMPLIEAAEVEDDIERQRTLIRTLDRRYYENPPGLLLHQMVGFVGLGPRIRNYAADFGVIRFDEISLVAPGSQ